MPFRSTKFGFACAAMLGLGLTAPVRGAEPAAVPVARVSAGIGSADQVIGDLQHLVAKLANKPKVWENVIYPNLEIFLIGVSTDQPIRFDLVFDATHGSQTQAIIPIADQRDFIENNLIPIGIDPTRERSDKDLYQLTGAVYEGWMRYIASPVPYDVFFPQKNLIPAGMANPEVIHKPLAEKGYVAFLTMENSADGKAARKAAFQKNRQRAEESFKKLSTETREQFELRKAMRMQSLTVMEQWLVEIASVQFGAKLNPAAGRMPGEIDLTVLPETALSRDLQVLKDKSSLFAAVQAPQNNVLTIRVNLPVNGDRKQSLKHIYELARPVLKDRIANAQNASAGERVAIDFIASSLLDILSENAESQVALDAFLDVYPVKDKHAILMGVSATGAEKFNQIIEKIPAANEGWTVDMNAEKVGETSIHRVTFGQKLPKSLVDFYGASNEVWIAVNAKSVWLAGGDGSLETLKRELASTAEPPAGPSNGVILTAQLNARPVIQSVDAISKDPELEILKQINFRGRIQQRTEAGKPADAPKEEKKVGGKAAGSLATFVWVPTAVAAMEDQPDRISVDLKLNGDGHLVGNSDIEAGVLKAVGSLIAKFADENLK